MAKFFYIIISLLIFVIVSFCCFQIVDMANFENYRHTFYPGHHFGFHQNHNGLFGDFSIVNSFFFLAGYLITKFIEFFSKNILGIFGLVAAVYVFRIFIHNYRIETKYKREKNGNDKKYSVKRCMDDSHFIKEGDKNSEIKEGCDHFYLIEEKEKEFHRIVNRYTLNRLGYPRPVRNYADTDKDQILFKNEGYVLGEEIEIIDLPSLISTLKEVAKIENK